MTKEKQYYKFHIDTAQVSEEEEIRTEGDDFGLPLSFRSVSDVCDHRSKQATYFNECLIKDFFLTSRSTIKMEILSFGPM